MGGSSPVKQVLLTRQKETEKKNMKRRSFGKLTAMGLGAGLISCAPQSIIYRKTPHKNQTVKPEKLKEGDIIGLIAPASPFLEEQFKRATDQILSLKFRVKYGKNLNEKYGYLAGSDQQRVDDIHAMFADPDVKAIWCIRGGYGTTRLLHLIDFDLISRHPKLLIGYSDVTALLQAIFIKTGMVGVHGPVAASEFTDYTQEHFLDLVTKVQDKSVIRRFDNDEEAESGNKPQIIRSGKMEGELAGGNLSLLAALAGTEFQLNAKGKLVFIEDVGEKPYRIDRMLTQLLHTAKLDQAVGIILGVFEDCEAGENNRSLSLIETFKDRLGNLGIPVYYGFSFGHIENMCSIPIGIKASFDPDKNELTLLESAVV